ncbi:hypothetical protein V6615_05175 [Oscillospiraceae bacterium PP1C4]
MVFMEIRRSIKKINDQMLAVEDKNSEKFLFLKKQLFALQELVDYSLEGDWTKPLIRQKAHSIIVWGYKGAMEHFKSRGIHATRTALVNALRAHEESFLNRIGHQTVGEIMEGRVDAAMEYFRRITGFRSEGLLLMQDLRALLPASAYNSAQILSSAKEIEFLRHICTINLQKKIASLDNGKLAKLMYILNSESAELERVRRLLVAYLLSDGNGVYRLLSEIKQVYGLI